MEIDLKKVDYVLMKNRRDRRALIPILQDIQEEYNWLPEEVFGIISREIGIPVMDIYGVATFYRTFSLKPRGKHIVTACVGTACHVRGGQRIVETLSSELRIEPGETTEDMKFSLDTVNCLGCCAIGPIVVIDGEYYGGMTSQKTLALLKRIEMGEK